MTFTCGFAQKQETIDSLLTVLKVSQQDTNKVIILNLLSRQLVNRDLDLSLKHAREAMNLALTLEYNKGLAISYRCMGNCKKGKGDNDEALELYQKSLTLSENAGDQKNISTVYNSIGHLYWNWGKYPKALQYYYRSLEIKERIYDSIGIAIAYHSIGNVHLMQKNDSLALHNLLLSLEFKKKLGSERRMISTYNSIGIIYYNRGDYNAAISVYSKCLEIRKELGDKLGMAESYNNLGTVFYKQKSHDQALVQYFNAKILLEELGATEQIMHVFFNIGMIYTIQRKFEEAIKVTKMALVIANEAHSKRGIKEANAGLSDIYLEMGNYQKAYEHLSDYMIMKDSLSGAESKKQVAEIEAQFKVKKAENEVKLLAKQNEVQVLEINQRNYLIYGLTGFLLFIVIIAWLLFQQNKLHARQKTIELEQRILRTQMNPHFVFNLLNSVQKFITENKQDKASEYLGDFGELLRNILDNSSKQKITIANEINTLRLYLSLEKVRLKDKLTYEITVDETIDEHYTLMPPLVIQPFVENAIWHGIVPKKSPGNVSISLKIDDNLLICTVEDDGIGIEKSNEMKLESDQKHERMGMKVTAGRVKSVEVQALERGTQITIHIPIT